MLRGPAGRSVWAIPPVDPTDSPTWVGIQTSDHAGYCRECGETIAGQPAADLTNALEEMVWALKSADPGDRPGFARHVLWVMELLATEEASL